MADYSAKGAEDRKDEPPVSKDELLSLVRAEMANAIGFENDAELADSRTRALNYLKGDMSKDVPSLENRSKVASTDLADAVDTIQPDLMEIFFGGDDVVSFQPVKPNDEEAAKQETEYLRHVLFQQNTGFLNFNTAIRDALILKTGLFKFWWHEDKKKDEEHFTGKNAAEVMMAAKDGGEVIDLEPEPMGGQAEPTYAFTLVTTRDLSYAKYEAVAPDDFSVASDTVHLADTSYCVHRSRPRVQDLIAEGYDPEQIRALPPYADDGDGIQDARDTAGENSGTNKDDPGDLRTVEIREHHIRLLEKDGKTLCHWQVVTNADATVALEKDGHSCWKSPRVPFVAGSPYMVSHRFYGESLADKLFEVQKIKTVLTRAVLDSSYFALNQRTQIATDLWEPEYTMADLLRNEPGYPVRVKQIGAIAPLTSGGLGFDAYQALEYFATVGEMRSGVVRNAQGLNPDTLHDTAKGALTLMAASQKRVRFIARVLAETLFKPLCLGLHAVIRENAQASDMARLNGKWVEVNPSQWSARNSMIVEVGLGASGKEAEIAKLGMIAGIVEKLVEAQGGTASGPLVTEQNLYAAARDSLAQLTKKGEAYITDPSAPPAPGTPPPQPPPPDPEMERVKGELQLQQQDMAAKQQQAAKDAEARQAIEQQKLELARMEAEAAHNRDLRKQDLEHAATLRQQDYEAQLAGLEIKTDAQVDIATAAMGEHTKRKVGSEKIQFGGKTG